ncbi:N(2)-acetyl-L-2,4-diaminobutanoate deacetylase DoeB [Paenochrobactrum sp. BZR 201-1]
MLNSLQRPSPITATVDLNKKGIQHGHLRLPYSRDDSAWGSVMIPICVIANNEGPTALLTGANHGDEYEGPAALFELAQTIDPAEVNGRIIIVPALNYPAFCAGTRTSPIDRGNLNRSFPGRADGTVTEKIADYVTRYLIPLADIVLDFHSGGKTLDFLPYAAAHELPNKDQEANCFAAVQAFNAPFSMKMLEIDAVGMLDTTVEEMGKVFVTTELGGAGTATATSIEIARKGTCNILRHVGILKGNIDIRPSQWLDMPSDDCFTFAQNDGLIAFNCNLGDKVKKGATIARIYPLGKTGIAPIEYHAALDGVLAARHVPGLIKTGDCLSVIATITETI